jgi:hypothetical protein
MWRAASPAGGVILVMNVQERMLEQEIPWWGLVAPTAFAVLATGHLAQMEPHGPLMVLVLLIFLMTQVGEIVRNDRTARPAPYLARVALWALAGPLMIAVLSPEALHAMRRSIALAFLAGQALVHATHVGRFGTGAARDAMLGFGIDLLVVWTYVERVLPTLE